MGRYLSEGASAVNASLTRSANSHGWKSFSSRQAGSRLSNGKETPSSRSSKGWAVRFALEYFGLPESRGFKVAGANGLAFFRDAWRVSGPAMYHMPEYVLRQEWFHGIQFHNRRIPQAFFDAIGDGTLLDYGCGTAEIEREQWIDKGGKTILMDIPGPNLNYTRRKYWHQNSLVLPTISALPRSYDGLICIDVLEHVEKPLELAKHLWENLRPGGFAILWFDPAFPHPGHLVESVRQIPAYDRWLNRVAKIHSRGMFDFVEKPKRWWHLC